MRIIFAGTPPNAAHTLKALHGYGIEIALVLTRTDSKVGRKGVIAESAVAAAARELGLEVHKANKLDDKAVSAILEAKADFAIVVAYGVILKQSVIDLLSLGWFNVHYSLLPAYRGAAPVQHSLLNQDAMTGVTVFKIDSGLDTGEIATQVATKIEPGENAGDLLARLTVLSESVLLEIIPMISAKLVDLRHQSTQGISLAPKLARDNFLLDVNLSASHNQAKVMAGNPEPMAYLQINNHDVSICEAAAIDSIDLAEQLLAMPKRTVDGFNLVKRDKQIYLECANNTWLRLIEVKPASKRAMPALDWANGLNYEAS